MMINITNTTGAKGRDVRTSGTTFIGSSFTVSKTLMLPVEEDVRNIDFSKVNPTAGPVYVKGAQPGDTLEVEMLDFQQLEWGWTALIPGFGLLADDFKEPAIKTFDLTQPNKIEFLDGINLFKKPIPGTCGVALPEPGYFNVVPPRKNGGNMDIRH